MGVNVEREQYEDRERERFSRRLRHCLEALEALLARPGFGEGPATVGAELEMFLIDGRGRPLPVNQKVLAESVDPRLTYELDRFNLECNLTPVRLAGRPFSALEREIGEALGEVGRAARKHRGRSVTIGILPTLRREDFGPQAMTDAPRYRALSRTLARRRREPFRVYISGLEPLAVSCQDVTLEGATTSFQVHLRVAPADFSRVFNAVQLATAPALAASGNSPTFLHRWLWEETRVALFQQATDDRRGSPKHRHGAPRVTFGHGWLQHGALEFFSDVVRRHDAVLPAVGSEDPLERLAAGALPGLGELRVHNSTVWTWNRAVYDPSEDGHLRIEMRALPAGPTASDMGANAAFLLGLALGIALEDEAWTGSVPFGVAEANFQHAARLGLEAELLWPPEPGAECRPVPARDLVRRLLPLARAGLASAGVEPEEVESRLALLGERSEAGQTGAVWQRKAAGMLERRMGREAALEAMLERYIALSESGVPVHRWPVEP